MQKALKQIHVFALERAGFKLASYRPLLIRFVLTGLEFVYCLVLTGLASLWTSYEALHFRVAALTLHVDLIIFLEHIGLQASYPIYL